MMEGTEGGSVVKVESEEEIKCEQKLEVLDSDEVYEMSDNQEEGTDCGPSQKVIESERDLLNNAESEETPTSEDKFLDINEIKRNWFASQIIASHINNILTQKIKKYQCQVCSKYFGKKSNLDAHAVVHSGTKEFECPVCLKKFGLKVNLTHHMATHSGEKKYKCDDCDKCFTQKGDLTRHLLIHSDVKNYRCIYCEKYFAQKVHLTRHMLVHSDVKNYKCDHCDKCFTEKGVLTRHQLIHSGVKKFKCEHCDRPFARKSHLTNHISKKHHATP